MKRFWPTFENIGRPHPINLGCGVTARDRGEALSLSKAAFPEIADRALIDVAENIGVSRLDPNHVAPNIGDVLVRGVWWPRVG